MSVLTYDKALFRKYLVDEVLGDGLVKLAEVAADDPNGYANEMWYGEWALLAVRIDDRVVAAARRCTNHRFPAAWKLTRWYRDPARNRAAVEMWALSKSRAKDAFVFEAKMGLRKPPDDRGTDLLAAVIANPRDQATRMIYADWLTEHGDDRGELIRISYEAKRPELVEREKVLLRSDGPIDRMMRASVSPFVINKTVVNGLVEGVAMTSNKLVTHGEHLFTRHPITKLAVYCRDPEEYARLAALPFLSRVTDLEIIGRRPPSERARLDIDAVTSGIFASVQRLKISNTVEKDTVWSKFLSELKAPALTSLAIEGAVLGLPVLDMLSKTLPQVRYLTLAGQQFAYPTKPVEPLVIAFEQLASRRLDGFTLRDWHIGDAAIARCMTALLQSKTLRALTLDTVTIGGATTRAIAESPRVTALERLSFAGYVRMEELAPLAAAATKLVSLETRRVAGDRELVQSALRPNVAFRTA